MSNQLGPQCQITPAHAVGDVDLPYFSAPVSDANANPADETLDVDLTYLANGGYSLFVVERRWADYGEDNTTRQEMFLGTTLPLAAQSLAGCSAVVPNQGLAFGYVYYNGPPNLTLDHDCNTLSVAFASVPTPPPSALGEETAVLDTARGRELWANGSPIAVDTSTAVVVHATGGAIGRGFLAEVGLGYDERFRGDIAEVLAYDAALEDSDRVAVEAYLAHHWNLTF
jgi:hypothetical protein